jgi:hypothetical protein
MKDIESKGLNSAWLSKGLVALKWIADQRLDHMNHLASNGRNSPRLALETVGGILIRWMHAEYLRMINNSTCRNVSISFSMKKKECKIKRLEPWERCGA